MNSERGGKSFGMRPGAISEVVCELLVVFIGFFWRTSGDLLYLLPCYVGPFYG